MNSDYEEELIKQVEFYQSKANFIKEQLLYMRGWKKINNCWHHSTKFKCGFTLNRAYEKEINL